MLSRLAILTLLASTTAAADQQKSVFGLKGTCPKIKMTPLTIDTLKMEGAWRTVYSADTLADKHGDGDSSSMYHGCLTSNFEQNKDAAGENLPGKLQWKRGGLSGFQDYLCSAPKGPEEYNYHGCRRYLYEDDKMLTKFGKSNFSILDKSVKDNKALKGPMQVIYVEGDDSYDVIMTYRCLTQGALDLVILKQQEYDMNIRSEAQIVNNMEKEARNIKFADYMIGLAKKGVKLGSRKFTDEELKADREEFEAFNPAYLNPKRTMKDWEKLRYYLTEPKAEIDLSELKDLLKYDLDIEIHVREDTHQIRTAQWWDETFPKLTEKLHALVPKHNFSETHYKITHEIEQCPPGDILSDVENIEAQRYTKAFVAQANFQQAVKQNDYQASDMSKAEENLQTKNYLNWAYGLSAQELELWKENYNLSQMKQNFMSGGAVDIEGLHEEL